MVNSITDLKTWIQESLFDAVPMCIAVIDEDFNLVIANRAFEEKFGPWKGEKCYAVYKGRDTVCHYCNGSMAFNDGKPRIKEEVGSDRHGRLTRYIKHTIPYKDQDGNIPFLLEISTDITDAERIRQEHQLILDHIPCNIVVLDRNLQIVRGNKLFKQTFGNREGDFCYKAFKDRVVECEQCPARRTLEDGQMHHAHSQVRDIKGRTVELQVTTVPLGLSDEKLDFVMEMAVDVTQILKLEDELKIAHAMMQAMIATSIDGVIAVDENRRVVIFNPAARNLLDVPPGHPVTRDDLSAILPEDFMDMVGKNTSPVYLADTQITTLTGNIIPARVVGMRLMVGNRDMGMAFSVQDLRPLKNLEKEKIEAERLAEEEKTVAGLAHGVKNLIMALEGGLYMLNTGMKTQKTDRLDQGLEILIRNTERISMFIKEFLTFSKGRVIQASPSDPVEIAREVVDLYSARAGELGIELSLDPEGIVAPANLDYEGMHECLTNLVGNAIDACSMCVQDEPCHVWVRVREKDRAVVFEVEDDGCGMDYEVKQKVFTNFFTTKGSGGTGLGLLTTKKIVHEHGGQINLESEAGEGTVFRIQLPLDRLPEAVLEEE